MSSRHSLHEARVRVRAIGRLVDQAMLSHQQAMKALQTATFLKASGSSEEDCSKLEKPERPEGPGELAKVDEQLQQLHGILKSITCVCNKASNALPPKWFDEGSEDLRGGGGEAVIAAAAAAAAAAVAGSIGNKVRLVSQRHKKLHEQQQEQQEEQIAAAEVDQSKEKLGNVIVGNVQLEAEVNTQRSRIDENEKSFPFALQQGSLDFTPYPTVSDRDISLFIRALSILHPSILPTISKLIFGREDAMSACKAITGKFLLPGAGVLQFDSLTKNLKEVHMAGCTGITDASLCHLSSFHSLQRLNLILCTSLSGPVIAHLSKCPSLKSLFISHTPIREEGLGHLSTVTTLQELWLHGCSISSIGLHHLGKIKSLEILSLGGCVGCTVRHDMSASLLHLSHLWSLKEVWLWGCDTVTSDTVTPAAAVASATVASATAATNATATAPAATATAGTASSRPSFTSYQATSLKQSSASSSLPSAKPLLVSTTPSPSAIRTPSASSLSSTKSACVKLTDKGLSLLMHITKLKRLHLKGCQAITDDGFALIAGLRLDRSITTVTNTWRGRYRSYTCGVASD
ncbi:unnamed protein product [Closterium sp. NIES-54]